MTEIHAFDPDGTPSPGAKTALDLRASVLPSDFGAAGNGSDDDLSALTAACSAAASLGRPIDLGAGAYALSGKLNLPPSLRVLSAGASLVALADRSDAMLAIQSRVSIAGHLTVTTNAEAVDTHRGVQIKGSDVSVSSLTIESPVDGAGSANGRADGLLVQGARVRIGNLAIRGFQRPLRIDHASRVRIDSAAIDGYVRGVYILGSQFVHLGSLDVSRSFTAEASAGANSLLIESATDSPTTGLFVADARLSGAGEHGVRLGGQSPISRVTFGSLTVEDCGRAGIKILGGTLASGSIHTDINLANVRVMDAGQVNDNTAAVQLHLCKRVSVQGLTVGRSAKAASVTNGVEVQGCEDIQITAPMITDVSVAGISLIGNLGHSKNIRLDGGMLRASQASGVGVRIATGSNSVSGLVLAGRVSIGTTEGANVDVVSGDLSNCSASWVSTSGAPLAGSPSSLLVDVSAAWDSAAPAARAGSTWLGTDGEMRRSTGSSWVLAD